MGGCRCVYRNCPSSTNVTPGLHYFHFPIRDSDRCDQWLKMARRHSLRVMPREKLRNKVICSLHFEDSCFTNEKHDRLIHSAVPTVGCEDAPEEEDLTLTNVNSKEEDNIMLIPTNNDNTKFVLPDAGFSGMSYTIYDDAVVPSSTVPLLMNQTEKSKMFAILRKSGLENESHRTPKRAKFTITSVNKASAPIIKTPIKIKTEPSTPKNNGNSITSYSLSSYGDDVTVELSQKKDDFDQLLEQSQSETPLLDNEISLQPKGDNEFSIAVVSESNQPNLISTPEHHQNDATINEIIIPETKNTDFVATPETEYIRMIRNNSKQIIDLKRLINRQNRLHKHLVQKKQLCKFRRKPWDKYKLLDNLKKYVKPSLMAILKLDILPADDVVLTDSEEKFITDLYTEDPDCYNVLRKKYKWNLPHADEIIELE